MPWLVSRLCAWCYVDRTSRTFQFDISLMGSTIYTIYSYTTVVNYWLFGSVFPSDEPSIMFCPLEIQRWSVRELTGVPSQGVLSNGDKCLGHSSCQALVCIGILLRCLEHLCFSLGGVWTSYWLGCYVQVLCVATESIWCVWFRRTAVELNHQTNYQRNLWIVVFSAFALIMRCLRVVTVFMAGPLLRQGG